MSEIASASGQTARLHAATDTDELRRAMLLRGLNATALSEASGISISTLARVLAGAGVKPTTLMRILQAVERAPELPDITALAVRR
jgi:predicted transcriptional regulator